MEMAQSARVWTLADLEHLPDDGLRYEVVDGELRDCLLRQAPAGEDGAEEMSGSGTPPPSARPP